MSYSDLNNNLPLNIFKEDISRSRLNSMDKKDIEFTYEVTKQGEVLTRDKITFEELLPRMSQKGCSSLEDSTHDIC